MKRIYFILAVILALSSVAVCFAEETPVVMIYTAKMSKVQGTDGWYFMEFGTSPEQMIYNSSSSRWVGTDGSSPTLNKDDMNTAISKGVGFKFVAPEKGVVRLRGTVIQPYADNAKGDGVTASILKGTKELWSSKIRYGVNAGYDLTLSVKQGEALFFKVSPDANNYYDWTKWWPTVEYLAAEYVSEQDTDKYFEKKNGEMTELSFNAELDGYLASDGCAFINSDNVMPTKECSLVKRIELGDDGRYRIYCEIDAEDSRGDGAVVRVYKNGEQFWEQLCVDNDVSVIDVRVLGAKGDVIDVEILANEFNGYNYMNYSCTATKYLGTMFCDASTSDGFSYGTIKEYRLSDLISGIQGAKGMTYYSVFRDQKYPMKYNASSGRWESTVSGSGGYISATTAYSGKNTDSVIELKAPESGILKIEGKLNVNAAGDGVLSKVFVNDKCIWSSRVGEERAVRWDEPYDVSYFQNSINVITRITEGDKITFSFNQWRLTSNDATGIGDISLKYVTDNPISKTTKWKIDQSIVVDTKNQTAKYNGETMNTKVIVENGTTYMLKKDIEMLFGETIPGSDMTIDGVEYAALRRAAEYAKMNVAWAAERFVLIHKNIPVFFGYPELSEIETSLKGEDLF